MQTQRGKVIGEWRNIIQHLCVKFCSIFAIWQIALKSVPAWLPVMRNHRNWHSNFFKILFVSAYFPVLFYIPRSVYRWTPSLPFCVLSRCECTRKYVISVVCITCLWLVWISKPSGWKSWRIETVASTRKINVWRSTLQKRVGCFNHRVVALVADKLERQWSLEVCFDVED